MIKPAVQGLLGLLAYFPLRFQYRFADALAFTVGFIPNRFSRQMRQNIGLCFPEQDEAAQKQLYRRALRNMFYVFTELAAVWYWPAEKILSRITTLEICAEFQQTARGKIVLAPHVGSWELLGIWLGQHCDAIILYKRLKDKVLDEYIRQVRGRTGGTPVSTKKHGLRKLLVGLRANSTLMVLPGPTQSGWFGRNVAPAGDVDGDGTGDFLVAAPMDSFPHAEAGRIWTLSGVDGRILRTIDGLASQRRIGWALDGGVDVNQDGFPDLILGDQYEVTGTEGRGRIWVRSTTALDYDRLCYTNPNTTGEPNTIRALALSSTSTLNAGICVPRG